MNRYLILIILVNGLIWLRSSFGKVSGGKFVGELGGTLGKFADKNPNSMVKSFLQNTAIPNSQLFGQLTMWGEVFVALTLTLGALYLLIKKQANPMLKTLLVLGLLGGMFLNGVFWLSSGWTSSSTESLNLLMFLVQGIVLVSVLKLAKS